VATSDEKLTVRRHGERPNLSLVGLQETNQNGRLYSARKGRQVNMDLQRHDMLEAVGIPIFDNAILAGSDEEVCLRNEGHLDAKQVNSPGSMGNMGTIIKKMNSVVNISFLHCASATA